MSDVATFESGGWILSENDLGSKPKLVGWIDPPGRARIGMPTLRIRLFGQRSGSARR
jgi:hypothetical protein